MRNEGTPGDETGNQSAVDCEESASLTSSAAADGAASEPAPSSEAAGDATTTLNEDTVGRARQLQQRLEVRARPLYI